MREASRLKGEKRESGNGLVAWPVRALACHGSLGNPGLLEGQLSLWLCSSGLFDIPSGVPIILFDQGFSC